MASAITSFLSIRKSYSLISRPRDAYLVSGLAFPSPPNMSLVTWFIEQLKAFISHNRIDFDAVLARVYPRIRLPPIDLHGKRAFVTGANTGIGKEVARSLAQWICPEFNSTLELRRYSLTYSRLSGGCGSWYSRNATWMSM